MGGTRRPLVAAWRRPDPDCAGDHAGPPAEEDDMTTTTSTHPDLSLVKARQQQTWAAGDYTVERRQRDAPRA